MKRINLHNNECDGTKKLNIFFGKLGIAGRKR